MPEEDGDGEGGDNVKEDVMVRSLVGGGKERSPLTVRDAEQGVPSSSVIGSSVGVDAELAAGAIEPSYFATSRTEG